jgi:hypothetical protein
LPDASWQLFNKRPDDLAHQPVEFLRSFEHGVMPYMREDHHIEIRLYAPDRFGVGAIGVVIDGAERNG